MHNRYKLIVTRDTNQRLLRMFMEAFDALPLKDHDLAPVVVARD